jgi:predicted nucleotidyltransferase
MINDIHPNIQILEKTVEALDSLAHEMVFIGGCATGLLITDQGAPPIRATMDVDVLVEVSSLAGYHSLAKKFRKLGFSEDLRPEAPICRWMKDELVLDVMPTHSDILGFGNQWYAPAFTAAGLVSLPSGCKIRILPAPYFLATKFEAFHGRGKNDYLTSKDMEDIISVFDGRTEIVVEIQNADISLYKYLNEQIGRLLKNRFFLEALPGHLPSDSVSQKRIDIILEKMRQVVSTHP